MTTFAYPNIQPSNLGFKIRPNTAVHITPFTDFVQTQDREGERWVIAVAYSFLAGDNRAILKAFMAKLNGRQHRFTMQDFGHSQRGVGGGTPLVKGAAQTGKTLLIDGAPTSLTPWLKAGDRVSVESKMYQLDDDVNTDGTGNATLTISPRIVSAHPDDDPVEIILPVDTFILEDGQYEFQTSRNQISTLSFRGMGVPNE